MTAKRSTILFLITNFVRNPFAVDGKDMMLFHHGAESSWDLASKEHTPGTEPKIGKNFDDFALDDPYHVDVALDFADAEEENDDDIIGDDEFNVMTDFQDFADVEVSVEVFCEGVLFGERVDMVDERQLRGRHLKRNNDGDLDNSVEEFCRGVLLDHDPANEDQDSANDSTGQHQGRARRLKRNRRGRAPVAPKRGRSPKRQKEPKKQARKQKNRSIIPI